MALKKDQWEIIRSHYERGKTPSEIARIVPFKISRQAIEQKQIKEGWERKQIAPTVNQVNVEIPDSLDSRRTQALGILKTGASQKMAYQAAGIPERTWYDWKKDPEFAELVNAVQAQVNVPVIAKAYDAALNDPKYSWEWLNKHPTTREEFGKIDTAPKIGQIKIGHLIQRAPDHRPVTIDQED